MLIAALTSLKIVVRQCGSKTSAWSSYLGFPDQGDASSSYAGAEWGSGKVWTLLAVKRRCERDAACGSVLTQPNYWSAPTYVLRLGPLAVDVTPAYYLQLDSATVKAFALTVGQWELHVIGLRPLALLRLRYAGLRPRAARNFSVRGVLRRLAASTRAAATVSRSSGLAGCCPFYLLTAMSGMRRYVDSSRVRESTAWASRADQGQRSDRRRRSAALRRRRHGRRQQPAAGGVCVGRHVRRNRPPAFARSSGIECFTNPLDTKTRTSP